METTADEPAEANPTTGDAPEVENTTETVADGPPVNATEVSCTPLLQLFDPN